MTAIVLLLSAEDEASSQSPSPDHGDFQIIYEGPIWKRSGVRFTTWKQRHMVLTDDGVARLYKKEKNGNVSEMTRAIDIRNDCLQVMQGPQAHSLHVSKTPIKFPKSLSLASMLVIVTSDRRYIFCCESTAESTVWESKLRSVSMALSLGLPLTSHSSQQGLKTRKGRLSMPITPLRKMSSTTSGFLGRKGTSVDHQINRRSKDFSIETNYASLAPKSRRGRMSTVSMTSVDSNVGTPVSSMRRDSQEITDSNGIAAFLEWMGCLNPDLLFTCLLQQGVDTVAELCDLNEDERSELGALLKAAGCVIGDRRKVMRATAAEARVWTNQGRRLSQRLPPVLPARVVGMLGRGREESTASDVQELSSVRDHDSNYSGESMHSQQSGGAGVFLSEAKVHLNIRAMSTDYCQLIGASNAILEPNSEFGPSGPLYNAESLLLERQDVYKSLRVTDRNFAEDEGNDYVAPDDGLKVAATGSAIAIQSFRPSPYTRPQKFKALTEEFGQTNIKITDHGSYSIFNGHSGMVLGVSSVSSTIIATVGTDKRLQLWDIAQKCHVSTLLGDLHAMLCVAAPNDRMVVSGGKSNDLRVWDIACGETVALLQGHTDDVTCCAALGENRVLSGSKDGTLILWDVNCGVQECELSEHEISASISCVALLEGNECVSGLADGSLSLWSLSESRCKHTMAEVHRGGVRCVVPSKSSHFIFTGGCDFKILGWEIQNGCLVEVLNFTGHNGIVSGLACLTDDLLASSSFDYSVRIWSTKLQVCVKILEGHQDFISALSLAPNGDLLSVGFDGTMFCWSSHFIQEDLNMEGCSADHVLDIESKVDALHLVEDDVLDTEDLLGGGNFGEVRRGALTRKGNSPLTVAVKTPKSEMGFRDLQSELSIHKEIAKCGGHDHVLRLILFEETATLVKLVLEYADGGSLLRLLHKSRGPPKQLTGTDMIRISVQVAQGMHFLSSRSIVHRDLSARNIVVDSEMQCCKVADFGLAKSIQCGMYVEEDGGAPVAWKWVALETLRDNISIAESDVWSFGIVLAEIVTFGAKPYPGISNAELLQLLEEGYRMPQNNLGYASAELYQIMLDCWLEAPEERPDFEELVGRLKGVIDMDHIVEVQEEQVARRESSLSSNDWNDDLGPELGRLWHAPYLPSPYFTGREEELSRVKELCWDIPNHEMELKRKNESSGLVGNVSTMYKSIQDCIHTRVGISSYGGAGKTQVMLQYARKHGYKYGTGIYWVEADSAERLRRSFIGIADILGVEKEIKDQLSHDDVSTTVKRALQMLSSSSSQKWLMCVDAVDVSVVSFLEDNYFPTSVHFEGDIIYTSRSSDENMWKVLGISELIQLRMLTPIDAKVFMCRTAKGLITESVEDVLQVIDALPTEEREALEDLVGNTSTVGLDGLPLAIEQAGAYMLRMNRSFHEYRRYYLRRMLTLLSQQKAAKSRADDSDHDHRSVATTWGMNVEDLSIESKVVLDAIACFHPERIPKCVLLRLVSIIEEGEIKEDSSGSLNVFREIVEQELALKFTLVTFADEGESVSIHRLMQLVVRSREGGANVQQASRNALAALYAECRSWTYQTVVDAVHDTRRRMIQLIPHIDCVTAVINEHMEPLPQSRKSSATSIETESRKSELDEEGPSNGNEGMIQSHGREITHRKSVKRRQSLRRASEAVIDPVDETRLHLAIVARAKGFLQQFASDYTGALKSLATCLKLLEAVHKCQDHPEIAGTIQQIGHVMTSKGDYARAAFEYMRALTMKKLLFGDVDHPELAEGIHRLATVLEQCDDIESAYSHYQESLRMKRKIYGVGKDHRDIASSLHRIGNILQRLGRYDEALNHYAESIDMAVRIRGKGVDHAGIAYSLHDSGIVLELQGNLDGALEKYRAAFDMRKRIYGKKKHPGIASSLFGIGSIEERKGNFESAYSMLHASLQMRKEIYDSGEDSPSRYDHSDVAEAIEKVGMVASKLSRHEEAQKCATEHFDMIGRLHGAIQEYKRSQSARAAGETISAAEVARKKCNIEALRQPSPPFRNQGMRRKSLAPQILRESHQAGIDSDGPINESERWELNISNFQSNRRSPRKTIV